MDRKDTSHQISQKTIKMKTVTTIPTNTTTETENKQEMYNIIRKKMKKETEIM